MSLVIGLSICFIVFFALFYVAYLLLKYQYKKTTVAAINKGQDVLWTWRYSPAEWKYAAENYFEIEPKRLMENGKVSFTASHIYVSNGDDEILFPLMGANKFTKHLTEVYHYKSSPMSNIRFQVRTKTIKTNEYGGQTMDEDYEMETLIVPVPSVAELESEKVVGYYQDILDKNRDAVAAVMPYGLGLFGK